MKRILCILLALLFLLTGCTQEQAAKEASARQPVKLRYYTVGQPDPDLSQVNQALNDLLLERYGFTVDYQKIDWNGYIETVNGILHTNQDFDVIFTSDSLYVKHASRGAFMNLNDFLYTPSGKTLYDTVDPFLWKGVAIHDQIYGVPTNKELAPTEQFLFSKELVEKYQLNVEDYTTMESLEPVLRMITRKEPDTIPLFFTSDRVNVAALIGYEYVVGVEIPLVVRSGDPSCQVCNLYDTPEMKQFLKTMRRYYNAGLVNADATVRTAISRFDSEQVFCRIGTGGPESAESFSLKFGYPIVTQSVGTPWINNTAAQGGVMSINAHTPHPKEAIAFLNAVNLDPDVRNLLNYGIEGVHYRLTEQDQVEVLSDGYRGVPYTQGNWFILKTMVGEKPDKWQCYRTYNQQVKPSKLLGFQPDLEKCGTEWNQVEKIYRRFDNALLTGSVDPEVYCPMVLRELKEAGVETLRESLQAQIDAWLEEQMAPTTESQEITESCKGEENGCSD